VGLEGEQHSRAQHCSIRRRASPPRSPVRPDPSDWADHYEPVHQGTAPPAHPPPPDGYRRSLSGLTFGPPARSIPDPCSRHPLARLHRRKTERAPDATRPRCLGGTHCRSRRRFLRSTDRKSRETSTGSRPTPTHPAATGHRERRPHAKRGYGSRGWAGWKNHSTKYPFIVVLCLSSLPISAPSKLMRQYRKRADRACHVCVPRRDGRRTAS
jgi:hypothetical protein